MQLVNPHSSFTWDSPLDINGVPMRGVPEKQGFSFSRAGYLAAKDDSDVDADKLGQALRRQLRPLSKPTLLEARREYSESRPAAFPRYFIIEPINICNRACSFCSITVMTRYDADGKVVKGMMPWETFMRLMRETAGHPVYGMSLYQLGEPFLWHGKDSGGQRLTIADMVNATKRVGDFRAVNLSTNGDVKNLDSILGSDLDDLIISIDGTTKEVYEANRPGASPSDTFERTVERVRDFLAKKAARGEPKPFVRLQIINKENTRAQVLGFIRDWIDVPGVDDVYVKNLDSMRSWLGSSVVSDEEDKFKADRVAAMACQHIFAVGSMVVNGDLNACCHDAYTELVEKVTLSNGRKANANINNTTFANWWHGKFMSQLRSDHLSGRFHKPCLDCRERDAWLG